MVDIIKVMLVCESLLTVSDRLCEYIALFMLYKLAQPVYLSVVSLLCLSVCLSACLFIRVCVCVCSTIECSSRAPNVDSHCSHLVGVSHCILLH